MKKKILTTIFAGILATSMSMTSLAGWEQEGANWKYNDNGTYAANGWRWIDGNGDGVAECYYFDSNGYMLANTTTPDSYMVNTDGAWTVNGVVQTKNVAVNNGGAAAGGVNHSAGYDPAHPLANAPESWNLKLTSDKNFLNYNYICSNDNIHAMLTGQMEYYHARTGYDSDRQNAEEQALYQWFCNWLNGMDFEHMSEMDRANIIKNTLSQSTYTGYTGSGDNSAFRNDQYTVLIEKKGVCAEFAMTAISLAKALGLKSAVYGTGNHAVFYIFVDGVAYFGQNNYLNLNTPTTDTVYPVG